VSLRLWSLEVFGIPSPFLASPWSSVFALTAVMAAASAQCTSNALAGFGTPGADDVVRVMRMHDPDGPGPQPPQLVIGGDFVQAGTVVCNHIAAVDPVTRIWSTFGSGIAGSVRALASMPNGDLIAGGSFFTAGGVPCLNIARWNGLSWSPLGAGISTIMGSPASVRALAVTATGDLLVGGEFTHAGGISAQGLARWNGSAWSAVGAGVGSLSVHAIATMPSGDIVIGGSVLLGGQVQYLFSWNGTTWSPFGAPTSRVTALTTLANGDLIAMGYFSTIGGIPANRIARWNGTSWSSYGNGIGFGTGIGDYVNAVAEMPNGDLVATGRFSQASGVAVRDIARWNGSTWSALGAGLFPSSGGTCLAVLPNGDLGVGGYFNRAGDVAVDRLARWDGAGWSGLANGMDGSAYALAPLPGGGFAVGGWFSLNNDPNLSGIAIRQATGWQPLGTGSGGVYAVAAGMNGDVFIGGDFHSAGGVPAARIARWDGVAWSPLGAGLVGTVQALALLPNGDLIAAGSLSHAGGVPVSHVARWNGTAWSAMGSGFNQPVSALTVLASGELIAGGSFTIAGGAAASRVARWTGTNWAPLGSGLSGPVFALAASPDGDLIAGGTFCCAGPQVVRHVARWDGFAWSALGSGIDTGTATVRAVAVLPNGDVVAGGTFSLGNGGLIENLARWDGSAWSTYGTGANGWVRSLAVTAAGELVVAGDFSQFGGQAASRVAVVASNCPAQVAATVPGCAGAGGLNVLQAVTLPWLGSQFRGRALGMPNGGLALAVTGLAPLSIPLSALLPQGLPGCEALVDPVLNAIALPTAGVVDTALQLPATTSLAGIVLFHQVLAVELDLSGTFTALSGTNRLDLVLGAY